MITVQKQLLLKSALLGLCTVFLFPSTALSQGENKDSAPELNSPVTQQTAVDAKVSAQDKKDIEKFLSNFEKDWNGHNLEGVMGNYSDDYVNNDGFDKKIINQLMGELWKTYPDIKSSSFTKSIRVDGPYATIGTHDDVTGTTASEAQGLGKGELHSISEGLLFCKRVGNQWKIIGDRIDYEKNKVSYGLGRQLDPSFAAPEQVKSGKQFSARLEVDMPTGLAAMGTISQATLSYPPPKPPEVYKPMGDPLNDRPLLERVMTANAKNRNELLMATIGLTNASRNSLLGMVILTRRLNVVPPMEEEPAKAETAASAETKKTPEETTIK